MDACKFLRFYVDEKCNLHLKSVDDPKMIIDEDGNKLYESNCLAYKAAEDRKILLGII